MLLSPIAWFASNAQQIIYFGAIIPTCIIFLVPILKESFRWQISNGKLEEGRETIKHFVAKCSGNISENELDKIIEGEEQSTESLSIRNFLSRFNIPLYLPPKLILQYRTRDNHLQ